MTHSKSRTKSVTTKDKEIQRKGSQSDVKCTGNVKKELGTRKKSLQNIQVVKTKERCQSNKNEDENKLSDVREKTPINSNSKTKENKEKMCNMN